MQAHHPNFPERPLSLPFLNISKTSPVLPQLGVQRIPFNQHKDQCFKDCVAYLMSEATRLRSEHRHTDALKRIDAALMLEALLHDGYTDV
ncbi:hypothetical protein [Acaryochloris marina]|uniref:hypothetical protein n=1 Tax=Acaryochloris marina TaxID=155978 RepID=UPI001BAED074|nr:hypothetical protein [Acaryochloris marina]QUY46273.1 hypothetical protein I1H34_31720 [Acaryochloris marina S15]